MMMMMMMMTMINTQCNGSRDSVYIRFTVQHCSAHACMTGYPAEPSLRNMFVAVPPMTSSCMTSSR